MKDIGVFFKHSSQLTMENYHAIGKTKEFTRPDTSALHDALYQTQPKTVVPKAELIGYLDEFILIHEEQKAAAIELKEQVQKYEGILTKQIVHKMMNLKSGAYVILNRWLHSEHHLWIYSENIPISVKNVHFCFLRTPFIIAEVVSVVCADNAIGIIIIQILSGAVAEILFCQKVAAAVVYGKIIGFDRIIAGGRFGMLEQYFDITVFRISAHEAVVKNYFGDNFVRAVIKAQINVVFNELSAQIRIAVKREISFKVINRGDFGSVLKIDCQQDRRLIARGFHQLANAVLIRFKFDAAYILDIAVHRIIAEGKDLAQSFSVPVDFYKVVGDAGSDTQGVTAIVQAEHASA